MSGSDTVMKKINDLPRLYDNVLRVIVWEYSDIKEIFYLKHVNKQFYNIINFIPKNNNNNMQNELTKVQKMNLKCFKKWLTKCMQCPEMSFVNKTTEFNKEHMQQLMHYARNNPMSDESSLLSLHCQLKACHWIYDIVRKADINDYGLFLFYVFLFLPIFFFFFFFFVFWND